MREDKTREAAGWPRLLRDVREGVRVRLAKELSTGAAIVPAGTEGVVTTHGSGWHLLRFEGEKCTCCGVKPYITRCHWRYFEVIR